MAALLQDTSFWALVFVLTFLGLMAYLGVFRKIGAALDDRAAQIAKDLDEAKRLREEASALLADYQRRAREAEAEAAAIVAQAREDAARMKVEAEQRLADMVERRTRAAELKIAQAEARAAAEVRTSAADVAVAAAERILRARVAGGLGADLIEKSIGDVRTNLN